MNIEELNQQEMRAQLQQLRAEVENLKAWAAEESADNKPTLDDYLKTLDRKSEDVAEKLKSMKNAGDEAMGDIANGLKEAMGRLEIAKRAARARFH